MGAVELPLAEPARCGRHSGFTYLPDASATRDVFEPLNRSAAFTRPRFLRSFFRRDFWKLIDDPLVEPADEFANPLQWRLAVRRHKPEVPHFREAAGQDVLEIAAHKLEDFEGTLFP